MKMESTLGQRIILDSLHSHGLDLEGNHHLPPYNILCVSSWELYPNDILSRNSQTRILKLGLLLP